jgi:acyl dehydratase
MVERRYYEDYEVGDKFVTPARTLTEQEVNMFCLVGLHAHPVDNTRNIHMNPEFARKYGFKDRVIPGVQTITYMVGLLPSIGLMQEAVLLGIDKAKFTAPLYPNDSITVESEVVEKKDVKKYPDKGIIKLRNTVKNQEGIVVLEAEVSYMINKRKY